MKRTGVFPLLALLLAAFAVVSVAAAAGWMHSFDLWVLHVIQVNITGIFDVAGALLSVLGSVEVTALAMLAVVLVLESRRRRHLSQRLALAFVVTGLVELAMKMALPQSPVEASAVHLSIPSFLVEVNTPFPYPSGHMIRSVLVLGAVFVLCRGKAVRVSLLAVLVLMALSRVYVGAHWGSDVIGGTLLGAAALVWVFGREEGGLLRWK